ncbi:hypothetical protein D3C77_17300 [compost metagenome]|uniref:hypothetical protein n=1 Tax=Aeromonas media TaxID=651 RepID=UPI000F90B218|nr:hypothetical protein [Aeromonas media]WOQ12558.1 hypothetical protein R2X36_16990 [Aeromonas media]
MSQQQPELLQRLQLSLNTQDGRYTADPFYCVFSKREIVVDADYGCDRIHWWHQEKHVEASETTARRLDLLESDGRETGEWVKIATSEIDHFETACFTEQGCKDFLEIQGHNLRKPFIYATSLFRNREMIALREAFMAGQFADVNELNRLKEEQAALIEFIKETADVLDELSSEILTSRLKGGAAGAASGLRKAAARLSDAFCVESAA